jgi:TAG lipase / steryl ester hydrolase / phospholipase A2 / LPA acyltransferase
MDIISTYEKWLSKARERDEKENRLEWRENPESELFHSSLLQEHLEQMQVLRKAGNSAQLIDLIIESLQRHSYELNNPKLYSYALSGTKVLIEEYFAEIEESLEFFCNTKVKGFPTAKKLRMLQESNRIHGETVLILSGGAALGIYHLGVTKALHKENLIPRIVSGASMGALVAGSICSKTDDELGYFFDNLEVEVHRVAISLASRIDIMRNRALMDPEQLKEHIHANIPELTFKEAYEKTGRVLNISVSASRKRQKPRVLNYITSPNVLIRNSVLASCAIPGVFPPVSLHAKNSMGEIIPYMESETWIDGSIHLDVPIQRIMRLHNVTRSIVSQANPHVLPFIRENQKEGLLPFLMDFMMSTVQFQALKIMDLGIKVSEKMPWASFLEKVASMMDQEYLGDINISYPIEWKTFTHLLANPNRDEFYDYINKGQMATWPKVAFIKDQVRLNKILESNIAKLAKR